MPRASLALFRLPNFRALWVGQLVSIFGDRFTYLALLSVVVAHARHPENPAAELSLLPVVSFLPAILLGPWIGALVDRGDTRRVLIASDFVRGLLVLAMIPAVERGGLPALLVLVFALYVANTFFLPARSAIVPLLVPAATLTEANSLATFAGVAATIAGSLAGGFLIDRFGWRWGFALDAATYFVSVVALWRIRLAPRARRAAATTPAAEDAAARYRRLRGEIVEGLRVLLRTPRAWGATAAVMLLWMAGGVLHVAVPTLFTAEGHVASGVGTLLASAAAGMVLGTLFLASRGRRGPPETRLAVALVGTGAALAAFSIAPRGAETVGIAFLVGLFVALLLVTTETAIQEAVPVEARGRVFALRDAAARVSVLTTAGIAGWAVSRGAQPRAAILVVGVVTLAVGLVATMRFGTGGSAKRGDAERERDVKREATD